ncbi:hypothetical protein DPEC_G00197670 [Dallia pectoralis]|uniref:Uncharacterized protein n=1 Tax=Dallia pectoralis TaxID=75939 RepID=A0ACC2G856_DALPE|nr:hypothetical protein DPEC_G00197670 [Dallia pectoralis]
MMVMKILLPGVAFVLGVFLLGLAAVCLCRKNDLVKGDMRTGGLVDSEDDGIYSDAVYINVQSTKTNHSRRSAKQDEHNKLVDLVMGDTNRGDLGDPGKDGCYSVITVSSDGAEYGQSSENENVDAYHVYCSVPD